MSFINHTQRCCLPHWTTLPFALRFFCVFQPFFVLPFFAAFFLHFVAVRFKSIRKQIKTFQDLYAQLSKNVQVRLSACPYRTPHTHTHPPPLRCSFSLNLHFAFERQLPAFVCEAPLETHKWQKMCINFKDAL